MVGLHYVGRQKLKVTSSNTYKSSPFLNKQELLIISDKSF